MNSPHFHSHPLPPSLEHADHRAPPPMPYRSPNTLLTCPPTLAHTLPHSHTLPPTPGQFVVPRRRRLTHLSLQSSRISLQSSRISLQSLRTSSPLPRISPHLPTISLPLTASPPLAHTPQAKSMRLNYTTPPTPRATSLTGHKTSLHTLPTLAHTHPHPRIRDIPHPRLHPSG